MAIIKDKAKLESMLKDLMHEAEIEVLSASAERFVRSVDSYYKLNGGISAAQTGVLMDIYDQYIGRSALE